MEGKKIKLEMLILIEALMALLSQFACKMDDGNYHDDAMSALENAFAVLEDLGFAENCGGNGHTHKLLFDKLHEALTNARKGTDGTL